MSDPKQGSGEVTSTGGETGLPNDRLYHLYLKYLSEQAAHVSRGVQPGSKAAGVLATRFAPMSEYDFELTLSQMSQADRLAYEERLRTGYATELATSANQAARNLDALLLAEPRSDDNAGHRPR